MNYTELTTSIKGYLAAEDVEFVSNLNSFIRNAEDTIFSAVSGPLYEKTSTTMLLAQANPFSSSPVDGMLDILEVRISQSAGNPALASDSIYLLRRDRSFIREAYPATGVLGAINRGVPRFYAVVSSVVTVNNEPGITIMVGPTPDEDYTAEVVYYGKTLNDSITNGVVSGEESTNTTWLSTSFPSVLLYGSLVHAAIFKQQEQQIIDSYKNEFREQLLLMKNMVESRQDTDRYSDIGERESVS